MPSCALWVSIKYSSVLFRTFENSEFRCKLGLTTRHGFPGERLRYAPRYRPRQRVNESDRRIGSVISTIATGDHDQLVFFGPSGVLRGQSAKRTPPAVRRSFYKALISVGLTVLNSVGKIYAPLRTDKPNAFVTRAIRIGRAVRRIRRRFPYFVYRITVRARYPLFVENDRRCVDRPRANNGFESPRGGLSCVNFDSSLGLTACDGPGNVGAGGSSPN